MRHLVQFVRCVIIMRMRVFAVLLLIRLLGMFVDGLLGVLGVLLFRLFIGVFNGLQLVVVQRLLKLRRLR